jgi:hypothetical protein
MTLQEWCDDNNYLPFLVTNDRIGIIDDGKIPGRWELWQLTDFAVESIQSGVIWFRSIMLCSKCNSRLTSLGYCYTCYLKH